jgi:DNA-binding response OmpR family regulator
MQQAPVALSEPLEGVVIGLAAWNPEAAASIQDVLRSSGALIQPIGSTAGAARSSRYDVVLLVLNSERDTEQYGHEIAMLQEVAQRERTIALLQEALPEAAAHVRDFVVAPFRPSEIVVRILRVLDEPRPDTALTAGNLELLTSTREVRVGDRRVSLTFLEFEVLRALLAADGGVLSRFELSRLLDHNTAHESRAMDIHVHRLRLKLRGLQGARIETVRGAGYRLSRSD